MCLELRGNALLQGLPAWMPQELPALEMLDVSGCTQLDLSGLLGFTQLTTLALQVRLGPAGARRCGAGKQTHPRPWG